MEYLYDNDTNSFVKVDDSTFYEAYHKMMDTPGVNAIGAFIAIEHDVLPW